MNQDITYEEKEERASELFLDALKKEYAGEVKASELVYIQLIEEENEDDKRRWLSLSLLAEMYKRHNMHLKMDKVGKQLCEQYPDNYAGFHVRLESLFARKKYVDAKAVIDCIPNDMRQLYSCIDDLVKYYIGVENYQMAEAMLKELAVQYGDLRSMICLGLLMLSKGQISNAIDLCDFIMANIDDDNIQYGYYAKVVKSIAEIRMKSIDAEPIDTIIDELLNYMHEHDIEETEMIDTLNAMKKVK